MSKYVPPHMRNAAGGGDAPPAAGGGGRGPAPQGRSGQGAFESRGGGDRGPPRQFPGRAEGGPQRDSFYGGGGGGYGSRGGGGGGGAFSRGGSGGYGRANEIGFHGSLRPDPYLEKTLFGEVKTAGINFDAYDDIPVDTSGVDIPEGMNTFDDANLHQSLRENLRRCGYSKPTPVQKFSVPIGVAKRDMMACAQTGSGKTGGFLFPTITCMLNKGPVVPDDTFGSRKSFPNALVLAPTRELATQIYDEAKKFCYCTGLEPVVVYGGADVRTQLRDLERGCDILVATPGRLLDLMERARIGLSCVKYLILDEADRMLDMGFEPQIRRIVEREDLPRERQTFMFSATFPKEIQRLAADFLDNYIFLTVGRVGSAAKDIKQTIEWVDGRDKTPFLMRLINNCGEGGLVLIFVETKRAADQLEYQLSQEGYPTTSIHGDRSQQEREQALHNFRTGRTPIMVATDVAARGLDISNVMYVINYDMPGHIDDYVHRIGRTGRAGNTGTAISMMNDRNSNIARELYELLAENGQEIPDFLAQMAEHSGGAFRGGRSGGRTGRGNFGGRDVRYEDRDHGRGGSKGGFGGASGGGGSYYGGGGGGQNRSHGGGGGGAW